VVCFKDLNIRLEGLRQITTNVKTEALGAHIQHLSSDFYLTVQSSNLALGVPRL
jgi:hypothetical protein